MAQTPAHTKDQIIAAAMALRTRGEEPTRPKLFNELGRRGQPNTAWNTCIAHRDQLDQAESLDDLRPGDEALSPELAEAYRSHRNTLAALVERIPTEACRPQRQAGGRC